jgi:uncharacterized protein affecting Mg2+/Co2+ transport
MTPLKKIRTLVLTLSVLFLVLKLQAQSYRGADFNGDGKSDLANIWNDGGSTSANVYLSNGTALPEARWATKQGGYAEVQRWFYADFNGDGKADMAKVWNDGGLMSCDVHLSNGSSFAMSSWAKQSGTFAYTDKWYVGDFNGDKRADLARTFNDGGANSVRIYLTNATGGFAAPATWSASRGGYNPEILFFVGDYNHDGKSDIAAIRAGTAINIDVHLSTGSTFTFDTWASAQGSLLTSMKWVAEDFDGDGRTDIATLWNDGGSVSINVFKSTGSAFTKQSWAVKSGSFAREHRWLVGDFNGDAKADIARLWDDAGMLSIESYQSTGTAFTRRTLLTKGRAYRDQEIFTVGDFNGDLKSDIAISRGDATNRYADVVLSTTGTSTISSFGSSALGSYYSSLSIVKPIWGDNFVNLDMLVGPVPVGTDLQAVLDSGNDLFLVKKGLYDSSLTLKYKIPYQRIETFNAMLLSDFAIIRQQLASGEQDTLIHANGQDYIHLENVVCDGNKYFLQPKVKPAAGTGQGAMVALGASDGHWVKRCVFYNTRTWSTCQIHQANDAKDCIVENNYVLGAGNGPRGEGHDIGETALNRGQTGWADGFSVGARNTKIRYNFIMDCTDVGIVAFGVPGGHIHDNMISNFSRESLGGINMVDGITDWDIGDAGLGNGARKFDFRGLVVENNEITARGARIQMGMAISNQAWVCELPEVFDFGVNPLTGVQGAVKNNILNGGAMGYGYVLSNLRNLVFQGNQSSATHTGKGRGATCTYGNNGSNPDVAMPFLWNPSTVLGSTIQSGMTTNTKPIAHFLFMNGAPKNADGYAYYSYSNEEADAIVKASYLEMLGRAPTSTELTNGRNQFTSNNLFIGDDFRRQLMALSEFKTKFGTVASHDLHIFRVDRWLDSIKKLDTKAIQDTGNYSVAKQLYNSVLTDLEVAGSTPPTNDAQFVSVTVPASVAPGASFNATVAFKNTGTTTWTVAGGHKLGSQNPQDNTIWGSTTNRTNLTASVAPGASYTFTVPCVAPSTAGNYNFQNRMVQDGVEWFGDVSTNKVIAVVAPNLAPTWSSNPVAKGNATVGVAYSGSLSGNASDPEGKTLTFAKVSGPTWLAVATNGALSGTAATADVGANAFTVSVSDGVNAAVSATLNITVVAPLVNGAQFVSVTVPTSVLVGSSFNATVTYKNTGTTTWAADGVGGYRLGSQNPGDNTIWGSTTNRTNLTAITAPGASYTFTIPCVAPSTAGNYNFQNRMVQDGVEWFGDVSTNKVIAVVAPNLAPTWSSNPIAKSNATVGVAYSGSLSGNASDPEGNTLTFAKVSGPTWLAVATNGVLSGTAATANVGANAFTVSVSDGVNAAVSATLNITVVASNLPPAWSSNPVVKGNATVGVAYSGTLSGNASDPEGKALTFAKVSGPTWLAVATSGALSGTAATANVGANTFTVSVSDGLNAAVSATLNITVVAPPFDNAQFVGATVPVTVEPSSNFDAKVTYINTGNITWTIADNYKLGSQNLTDNTVWGAATARTSLTVSVAPGESYTFTVPCVAPSTEGNYNFQRQMVKGTAWFGELSLNKVVAVKKAASPFNDSQFVMVDAPATIEPGLSFQAKVTFINTGNTTWTEAELYRLGSQGPQDNQIWGATTGRTKLSVSVYPGESYTFTIPCVAPTVAGTYNFEQRMVKENVEWFGASSKVAIIVKAIPTPAAGTNNSQFISWNPPSSVKVGQSFTVSVTYQNTGANTWTATGNYKLGSMSPRDNTTWGSNRTYMSKTASVPFKGTYTFTISCKAPLTAGTYQFQSQMVKDPVAWFGATTPIKSIIVTK